MKREVELEDEEKPVIADLDAILDGTYDEAKSDRQGEDESENKDKPARPNTVERLERAHLYAQRLDATSDSCPTGHAFINGKHFDLDDVSEYSVFDLEGPH